MGMPLYTPGFDSEPWQQFPSQPHPAHSVMMSRLGINSIKGKVVMERLATTLIYVVAV